MNLEAVFAVLKPDMSVDTIDVTTDVYEQLDSRFNNFIGHSLVAMHSFTADWGGWEKHPKGDELVVLISGSVRMALKLPEGERETELNQPGSYVVVPRGVWHTAKVDAAASLLFITPGEGTEHSSQP
ncbi:MAG: cupin [Nevskiales bacterium]